MTTCLFNLSFWIVFFVICALISFGAGYLFLKSNLKVIRDFPNHGDVHRHITGWKAKSYDESLDDRVKFVRHALAIDETRSDFSRVRWGKKNDRPDSAQGEPDWFVQMWFAGNHSDIGGGYAEDESRLSDITLDWMVKEIAKIPYPVFLDHTKLNIFPFSGGMQHSEVEALRDSYCQCVPTALRFIWQEKPRDDAEGAPCHPSVMERFKLPSVLQYGKAVPYRPTALKSDPRFKEFYDNL